MRKSQCLPSKAQSGWLIFSYAFKGTVEDSSDRPILLYLL